MLAKNQKVSKYNENDCRYKSVYSRDQLPRMKYRVHVINLDDKQSKGTH